MKEVLDFIAKYPTTLDSIRQMLANGWEIDKVDKSIHFKKDGAFGSMSPHGFAAQKPKEVPDLMSPSANFGPLNTIYDKFFKKFLTNSHSEFYLPRWKHTGLPEWTDCFDSPLSYVILYFLFRKRIGSWPSFVGKFKENAARQYVFNALHSFGHRFNSESHSHGFFTGNMIEAVKIIKKYGESC